LSPVTPQEEILSETLPGPGLPGQLSRRAFIATACATATTPLLARVAAPPVRAIAFDGFPIFDPRSVAMEVHRIFPENGPQLASSWSIKLFAYTWLVTAARQYEDFETLAARSLRFTVSSLGMPLSSSVEQQLVGAYSHLNVWPDVKPALELLRTKGVRLAFLSNLSEAMLDANMLHAGIADYFERPLSTDRVRRFKPAPEAYAMALSAFGLPRDQIGFAAFGGWDAAGATWFGYRTAWINRLEVTPEDLAVSPAIIAPGIGGVLQLAGIDSLRPVSDAQTGASRISNY
jgi:2-haloacid dehalogenase